ncbi:hypothetical protein K435DRAFT_841574 [Dendrothele bispora CBS 962.96]|uniref:XPA C-terminal domain-containing protein n=1 Tax=Dendrothele bispora (strain CBS 962.96) TaxID=1314807 RepID=A0A4S8LMZ2_DENBC|nr:hypothetical protein K435DRAFT_841574 [Dendrothele bispora CBS 962.96]
MPTLRSQNAQTSNPIPTDGSPFTSTQSDTVTLVRSPSSNQRKRPTAVDVDVDSELPTRKKSRSSFVVAQAGQEEEDQETTTSVAVKNETVDTSFKSSETLAPIREEPGSLVKKELQLSVKNEPTSSLNEEEGSSEHDSKDTADEGVGPDGSKPTRDTQTPARKNKESKEGKDEKGKSKEKKREKKEKGPGKKALKAAWDTWCQQHVWPFDNDYKLPGGSRYLIKTLAQSNFNLKKEELATLPHQTFKNQNNPKRPGEKYAENKLYELAYRKHAAINGVEGALEEVLTNDVLEKGKALFVSYMNKLKPRSDLSACKKYLFSQPVNIAEYGPQGAYEDDGYDGYDSWCENCWGCRLQATLAAR